MKRHCTVAAKTAALAQLELLYQQKRITTKAYKKALKRAQKWHTTTNT